MIKRFLPVSIALPAVVLCLPALASSHSRHATTRGHATASHAALKHTTSYAVSAHGRHGAHLVAVHHEAPPAMDSTRAIAIQTALIRAGYMTGEPSGTWDSSSIAAMQKLQDDNGWQTKYTPDSRALAKLGLGAAPLPATPPTGTPVAIELAPAAPVAQP